MNDIFSERLISLRELGLLAFALMLLAVTPTENVVTDNQQPVKLIVPVDDTNGVKSA